MFNGILQKKHNHALRQALEAGDSAALCKAIRKGADVNLSFSLTSDQDSHPPIAHALRLGRPECLTALLEAGATPPDTEQEQLQLLLAAVDAPDQPLALLTALLRHGFNPDLGQGTAFFHCLQRRDNNLRLLLLSRLIEFGGDINVADSEGRFPLDRLIMEENRELIGTLIGAGAETSVNADELSCSEQIRDFVRRKQQDLETRRLLQS